MKKTRVKKRKKPEQLKLFSGKTFRKGGRTALEGFPEKAVKAFFKKGLILHSVTVFGKKN